MQPLERLHVDHAEWKRFKLFICADSYSKPIYAWFVKSTTAEETCRCLTELFSINGIHEISVSDYLIEVKRLNDLYMAKNTTI